jgi:hypothetical protein
MKRGKMRHLFLVFWMLFASATSAIAQVSVGIGIGLPGLSIGINLPAYPEMVPVPGYPVYYAPRLSSNFFFCDGMYWVYQGDNWYASSWYNGPWGMVGPESVPLFVLRIPVRYYRSPPPYFYGWQPDGPPRWGEHWGRGWEQQRSGWDRWNRSSAPAPAPLPVYQRQYSGDRYPQHQQQQQLHNQNYRYQPRVTLSCGSSIRKSLGKGHPRLPCGDNRALHRSATPCSRKGSDPARNSRSSWAHAPSRRKGAVKSRRSQHQPAPRRNQQGRPCTIDDSSPSRAPLNASSWHPGQTRKTRRKARVRPRRTGKDKVRKRAATRTKNEDRVGREAGRLAGA